MLARSRGLAETSMSRRAAIASTDTVGPSDVSSPLTSSQWQVLVAGDKRGRLSKASRGRIIESGVQALACASSIDEYVMADVVARVGDRSLGPMLRHALDPNNARANHVAAAMGYFPTDASVRALERTVSSGDPLVVMRSLDACLRIARGRPQILSPERVPRLVRATLDLMDPETNIGYGTDERAATLAAACFMSLPRVRDQLRRRSSGGYLDRVPQFGLSARQRSMVDLLYGRTQAEFDFVDASLERLIRDALYHPDGGVRAEARFLLRASPYASPLAAALVAGFDSAAVPQRQAMARMMGILGQAWVSPYLERIIQSDDHISVRLSATGSLCEIPFEAEPSWISIRLAEECSSVLRLGLVHASGTHGWLATLRAALADVDQVVRREAAYWISAPVSARTWPNQLPKPALVFRI